MRQENQSSLNLKGTGKPLERDMAGFVFSQRLHWPRRTNGLEGTVRRLGTSRARGHRDMSRFRSTEECREVGRQERGLGSRTKGLMADEV